MERARVTWTDERLDDLAKSVDRVDHDLRQLRTDMNARFDGLEGRLGSRIDAVEGRIGARIEGLNRSMFQVGGAIVVTGLATIASVFVTNS
jgi:hypothetical protein